MDNEKLKSVLREAEELPLPAIRPRALKLPLEWPGGPRRRLLIARETAGRAAPRPGRVVEAWRYLAGLEGAE